MRDNIHATQQHYYYFVHTAIKMIGCSMFKGALKECAPVKVTVHEGSLKEGSKVKDQV